MISFVGSYFDVNRKVLSESQLYAFGVCSMQLTLVAKKEGWPRRQEMQRKKTRIMG